MNDNIKQMLVIEFKREKIPTATSQQKGVRITKNGKPHFYEKKKVSDARGFYREEIQRGMAEQGWKKAVGPVNVFVGFTFTTKSKPKSRFKTTRPDLDNLLKLVLDAATDSEVWNDDSQVVLLESAKFLQQTSEKNPQQEKVLLSFIEYEGKPWE